MSSTSSSPIVDEVRRLLEDLPTSTKRIISASQEAKGYARAAGKILELYAEHPDEVQKVILVSDKSEVPRSESTIILMAPPTAKASGKSISGVEQNKCEPSSRKRKQHEAANNSNDSSPPPEAGGVRYVFGGAATLLETENWNEDPAAENPRHIFMIRCKGENDKHHSGFNFRRVRRKPESTSRSIKDFDPCDAFALVHAVANGHSDNSSDVSAPISIRMHQPPSSFPPREPALAPAHPFACALREANVEAVQALLSQQPQLAQAYVAKPPHWTPPNFEVSALTEVLYKSEAMPERVGKIVELLLNARASINARDTIGATPLHQAATRGSEHVINILLDAEGAHDALWAETQGNWLPLHNASNMKREGACRLLVQRMLDVYASNTSDCATENASMMLEDKKWLRPGRCDMALMDRIVKEEADNWGFANVLGGD